MINIQISSDIDDETMATKSTYRTSIPPGMYKGYWRGNGVFGVANFERFHFEVQDNVREFTTVTIMVKLNGIAYARIV